MTPQIVVANVKPNFPRSRIPPPKPCCVQSRNAWPNVEEKPENTAMRRTHDTRHVSIADDCTCFNDILVGRGEHLQLPPPSSPPSPPPFRTALSVLGRISNADKLGRHAYDTSPNSTADISYDKLLRTRVKQMPSSYCRLQLTCDTTNINY